MTKIQKPYIGQLSDMLSDYKREIQKDNSLKRLVPFSQYVAARMIADSISGIQLQLSDIERSLDEIAKNSNK